MPKVGKKKFPYTNKGIAAAKKYAKENDLPIIWTEDAKSGMAVPGYAEGGGVRFYEAQKSQGGGGLDLYQPTTMSGMGVGGGSKGGTTTEEQQHQPPGGSCPEGQAMDAAGNCFPVDGQSPTEETPTEETPTEETPVEETPVEETDKKCPEGLFPDESGNCVEPMSKTEERFEDEEQEKEFYKDTADDGDERAYSTTGRPLSDPQGGGAISVADAKKAGGKNILSQSERWGHDKGDHQGALGNISIISDKSGDKGEGLFAGGDKGSGESITDKIKDKTSGGGGTNPLEAIKEKAEDVTDEVSAKKGAVVKVNKKKRKLNKGGKMNKKGMAIIIAIGRPKVNRKKR
jgi:hypothetical protein